MRFFKWFWRQNKYKKIFFLSLLPYIVILICCVFVAVFGYEWSQFYEREYGERAVRIWLDMYLFDWWFSLFGWIHLLFLTIVPYQILYLLKLRYIGKPKPKIIEPEKPENIERKETKLFKIFGITVSKVEGSSPPLKKKKTAGQIAEKVFLVLSFLPFIYLLFMLLESGIGNSFYYILLFALFVPIFPVCVIYQIIYLIVKITEKRK